MQRVRLVQRNLEHARRDLHSASQAAGRGIEDREIGGRYTARDSDIERDGRWRCLVAFDNECAGTVMIDVAQLLVELFDSRQCPRRP